MSGSMKKEDPAEISVSGTLYRIEAEISKGDFGVLMAFISENIGEKGAFQTAPALPATDRSAMTLPVKPKYSGSRTSLASNSSLLGAMKVPERDVEVKAVEFSFKLRGLQVSTHTYYISLAFYKNGTNFPCYLLLMVTVLSHLEDLSMLPWPPCSVYFALLPG